MDERSLVGAAVRGDREAVRAVWQENRRWVAAVLLAHKPREADLEDLLQDVAMTFVRSIGGLRDRETLRPWLRTVAINAARAAGRDARRRRRRESPMVGEVECAAEAHTGARDEASRLVELARELPEGYREPLLLRCVRGMSYRQIGALLGLPETTVETRITRGRRMLRELARGDGVDSVPLAAGRHRSESGAVRMPGCER